MKLDTINTLFENIIKYIEFRLYRNMNIQKIPLHHRIKETKKGSAYS